MLKNSKLWNMKMIVRQVMICALKTVRKGLIRGTEELEIRECADIFKQ